jgi:predicted RND superfamily exporter protein
LIETHSKPGFYARFAKFVMLAVVVAVPALGIGTIKAVRSNNNQVEDWLPASFHETRQLGWFRDHFAADQFVIISWPGCRLGDPEGTGEDAQDDPRIEKLADALVPDSIDEDIFLGSSRSGPENRYFKSVTTGRRVLDALLKAPASVPYKDAVGRLQGALIGPDGRQTCVVVTLTREATKTLRDVVGRGNPWRPLRPERQPGELFKIMERCGIDTETVRLGGPPIDNVAIDEEGEKTLVRLAGLSLLFGLGLAWWSLRSIRLTVIVFGNGILSSMLAMSLVWFTGSKMDAVLMSMPLLVYVLAVSGAVHVVNYYRQAIRDGAIWNATDRAIHHAWRPALLCSITTAVGLASLCTSDLEPIRKFGLYSALGVGSLLFMTFVYLPSALHLFDKRIPGSPNGKSGQGGQTSGPSGALAIVGQDGSNQPVEIAEDAWTHDHRKSRIERLWSWCAIFLIRRHWQVAAICTLIIVGATLGLSRVQTSIDLLKLFKPEARIVQDYSWFEKNIGPLVPLEIVVRFPPSVLQELNVGPDRFKLDDVVLASPDQLEADKEYERAMAPQMLNFLERFEVVSLCMEMIERKHGTGGKDVVGKSMSPVTFASVLPPARNDVATMGVRSATNDVLWKNRKGFVSSGFLGVDPKDNAELWRISMRVRAFAGVDFGAFLHETRATIHPVLLAHEYRIKIAQEVRARASELNGSRPTATIWIASPDGKPDSVPEQEQFFIRSLFQLLTREGLDVRMHDLTSKPDPGDPPQQFEVQIVTTPLTAEQHAAISARSSLVMHIPLKQEIQPPAIEDSDDAKSPDPLLADGVRAIYTGVVPIVYKSQRKLLEGLITSTAYSFLTITPLMIFVCRGILPGLVVMIPNTLPVLIIFGGMGWLGAKVDIGSMMAASIALGVAVDDTIHFLTWFRQSLSVTRGRRRAIVMAYRHCASPTMQSALISGLGLSVFTLSSFTPTQKLGYLMLAILFAGALAELFMLPAILAGPLGRAFSGKQRRPPPEPQEPTQPTVKLTTSDDSQVQRPKILTRRRSSVAG